MNGAPLQLMFFFWNQGYLEASSEPYQTSEMELFVKIVNGLKPVTIFVKSFIFGV